MGIKEFDVKKDFKIVGIILGVARVIALIYGIRVWLAYNGFLDKVTGNDPETKEYSVVVLSTSNTNEIHELNHKHRLSQDRSDGR